MYPLEMHLKQKNLNNIQNRPKEGEDKNEKTRI
jgi:hypothetical protein